MSTLPIRVREVVGRDGSRARSLHVFCPRERSSIPPERCARCSFRCPPEDARRAPAIGCRVDEGPVSEAPQARPLLYGPNAAAARVPAGAASAQLVMCLHADVPLGVVLRALVDVRRWLAYPVVDSDGVLLGSIPSAALAVVAPSTPEALLPASEAMLPVIAVRESDHLHEAIGAMTSHHLRHLPIVDGDRRVTGVLSDLELLRWVARGAPSRWF